MARLTTVTGNNAFSRRRLLLAASAAAVATACGRSPAPYVRPAAPSTTGTPSSITPTVLGFSTGSSVLYASPGDVMRTMDAVADSGATAVRVDVSWTFAQPSENYFDWSPSDRVIDAARARGLTILATITNSPTWAARGGSSKHTTEPASPDVYGTFAGAVADRYRGRVASYEVWNEPNALQYFSPTPDPARYTALLRSAYRAIKAADPSATVVAGALANTQTFDGGLVDSGEFLNAMYEAGAQGSFDAVSFHPYDFGLPIGDGAIYDNSPMQQMIAMHRSMIARGDGDKKIWITEYGAPDTDVDRAAQAELIVDSAQQWSEVPYGGPFFVYTVRDADSASPDREDRYGVLFDNWEPKPAFQQFSALAAAGVEPRSVVKEFDSHATPELGMALSPVFALSGGFGRQYAEGSLYQSQRGWFVSPPDIATIARKARLVPGSAFADGYQDLVAENGVRVFSDPRFGTHIVSGAILDAWRPELGFPLTDAYIIAGAVYVVDFENGRISWNSNDGSVSVENG